MKINEKQLMNIVEEATRKALKEISYTTIDNSLTKSATLVNYLRKVHDTAQELYLTIQNAPEGIYDMVAEKTGIGNVANELANFITNIEPYIKRKQAQTDNFQDAMYNYGTSDDNGFFIPDMNS